MADRHQFRVERFGTEGCGPDVVNAESTWASTGKFFRFVSTLEEEPGYADVYEAGPNEFSTYYWTRVKLPDDDGVVIAATTMPLDHESAVLLY